MPVFKEEPDVKVLAIVVSGDMHVSTEATHEYPRAVQLCEGQHDEQLFSRCVTLPECHSFHCLIYAFSAFCVRLRCSFRLVCAEGEQA